MLIPGCLAPTKHVIFFFPYRVVGSEITKRVLHIFKLLIALLYFTVGDWNYVSHAFEMRFTWIKLLTEIFIQLYLLRKGPEIRLGNKGYLQR